MFRSHDHPQGAYFVHGATIKTVSAQQVKLSNNYRNIRLKSKEQSMLPEDDRTIETRRSVLSVLM
jgi:hypothetical protein